MSCSDQHLAARRPGPRRCRWWGPAAASVTRLATAAGIASISTNAAPDSSSSFASADQAVGGRRRSCPAPCSRRSVCTDCGVRPMCAHTGTPRSTRKRVVSTMCAPPSSFTICAPAAMRRAALRKACAVDSWKLPKGMSASDQRLRAAARHAAHVILGFVHRDRQRRVVALDHHAERVADQQDVHARRVAQAGEARVVAGQHRELLARARALLQLGDGRSHALRKFALRRDAHCARAKCRWQAPIP